MRAPGPLLAACLSLLLLAGAGCGAPPDSGQREAFLLSLAREVDAARMMETIEFMAGEGLAGRPSGSPQSRRLEAHIEERMALYGLRPLDELGLEGFRQEFPVPPERCFLEPPPPPDEPVVCANILAKLPGSSSREMIVLAANYDGLGTDISSGAMYPGADYNASGSSALMELARVLSSREERPASSIVFAFLGAEECGGFGAAALAEALEDGGLRDEVRVINIEALGAGGGGYMDVWDLNYRKNRPTVRALDEAAALLGVVVEPGGADPGTSAGVFFLHHIPAVTCDWSWFSRDEHPHFHQPGDTPESIEEEGLLQVTRVVGVAAWILGSGPGA